ncbi:MAG: hypothetical protein AAFU41_01330 [Pseudomonadota bacterium]
MIRLILPVTICLGGAVAAEQSTCNAAPYSQDNCVRVLACVGFHGVYFDGQARGWDEGPVSGQMSTGVTCSGTWTADGPFGAGMSRLQCDNGIDIGVIYHTQDNETSTVIGNGSDTAGQPIEVWSGENVLEFLTPEGEVSARLPCPDGAIPMS